MIFRNTTSAAAVAPALAALLSAAASLPAQPITVQNHSFEDTTGQSVLDEFTFVGTMVGWDIYDPSAIAGSAFIGTLFHPEDNFFSEPSPDGDRVGILYNSSNQGGGEYGFQQTLPDTVQGDTNYILEVEVGDIDSGTATSTTFFDLEGFPGYRVELLADLVPASIGEEIVLGSDNDTVSIVEGFFETSTVNVTIPPGHPQIGEQLAIRLVNLNQLTGIVPIPDSEVDFDNVRLTMATVPVELDLFQVD